MSLIADPPTCGATHATLGSICALAEGHDGNHAARVRPWPEVVANWLALMDLYRTTMGELLAGRVCVYCGEPASSIDHVVPRSGDGKDDPSNLVPCCPKCNASKGARSLETWLGALRTFIANAETSANRVRHIEAVVDGFRPR